jgi:hypothetical protein
MRKSEMYEQTLFKTKEVLAPKSRATKLVKIHSIKNI